METIARIDEAAERLARRAREPKALAFGLADDLKLISQTMSAISTELRNAKATSNALHELRSEVERMRMVQR